MSDGNVISLAAHRAKVAERVLTQKFSVSVEHYRDQPAAEFRVNGLGKDLGAMDVEAICRDLVDAVMCLSSDYQASGGTSLRPVAAVLFYDSGKISTTIDRSSFHTAPMQDWLIRQLPHAAQAFVDLFEQCDAGRG